MSWLCKSPSNKSPAQSTISNFESSRTKTPLGALIRSFPSNKRSISPDGFTAKINPLSLKSPVSLTYKVPLLETSI